MNRQIELARHKVRELSSAALAVCEDRRLTPAQQKSQLDKIEPELKHWSDELTDLQHVEGAKRAWSTQSGFSVHDLGNNLGSAGPSLHTGGLGGRSFDASAVIAGSSPSLVLTPDQQETLFKSVRDRLPVTVKTPVGTGDVDPSTFPMQYLPPVLAAREPTRILDILPTSAASTGAIEYYTTTGTTAADAVAEGDLKPQSAIAFTKQAAGMTKIAHFVEATEEAMSDFQPFTQLLSADLVAGLIDAENRELLSGSGTAPHNFKGLLVVTGTQSYTQDVSPETALDAIEKGATQLRAGGRFVNPDGLVMHPDDYSAVRRIKDSAGRYVADAMSFGSASPLTAADSSPRLWNLPVTLTSEIPAKTVLVGNFARAAIAWIREGISVRVDPYSQMTSNLVNIVAEERLALGVVAPSALSVVTLL